jgi:hypothetical protein
MARRRKGPALTVEFVGMDALLAEIREMGPALEAQAETLLISAASTAQSAIIGAYPVKTGNLIAGVTLTPARGRTIGAVLSNTAPHALLYEKGTKPRETKRRSKWKGYWNKNRGTMPEHPTFIPIARAFQKSAMDAIRKRLYQMRASKVTTSAA